MKKNLGFLKRFISNNVNPPEMGFVSKFWPREMKIAKELFAEFPDEAFFANILINFGNDKNGKLKKANSLAYFKTKDGHTLLKQKYQEFHFVPEKISSPKIEISDGKFGETTYNHKPPQFLSDFLN